MSTECIAGPEPAAPESIPALLGRGPGFLALHKPAGLPVFPPHVGDGPSLHAWLAIAHPEQREHAWPEGFALGLAHRLDTKTSGVVLCATDPEALVVLRGAFAARALEKTYLFVTDRSVRWDAHTVTTRLAHDRRHKARMVAERGRATAHRGRWMEAHTALRRVGAAPDGDVWRAVITTGVTHQVRLHAAIVGLPLLGDALYGGTRREGAFLLHHVGITAGPFTSPLSFPKWAPPGAEMGIVGP